MNPAYTGVVEKLVERILALIPTHPEILTLRSAWGLFEVPGFDCKDLEPSMAQAEFALAEAKRRRRLGAPGEFEMAPVPCETCGAPTLMDGTKRCNGCWEVERRLEEYLVRGGERAREFIGTALGNDDVRRRAAATVGPLILSDDNDVEYEEHEVGHLVCAPHRGVCEQTVEDTVLVNVSREGIELCADVVMLTPVQAHELIALIKAAISKSETLR